MKPTRAAVTKHAPWVALLTAIIVPTLSYLEARATAKAAEIASHRAQRTATERTVKVEDTQSAVYKLIIREVDRLGKDTDACHERIDKLASAVQSLADASRRATITEIAPEMIQQASVVRPLATDLPKRKEDVSSGDPLAGALE